MSTVEQKHSMTNLSLNAMLKSNIFERQKTKIYIDISEKTIFIHLNEHLSQIRSVEEHSDVVINGNTIIRNI